MDHIVDARGLSCPQPVMMTLGKFSKVGKGDIVVLVDTDTARENVSRSAQSKGWTVVDVQPEDEGYRVHIRKDG